MFFSPLINVDWYIVHPRSKYWKCSEVGWIIIIFNKKYRKYWQQLYFQRWKFQFLWVTGLRNDGNDKQVYVSTLVMYAHLLLQRTFWVKSNSPWIADALCWNCLPNDLLIDGYWCYPILLRMVFRYALASFRRCQVHY